jgi:peptidylprolyl isomerase
MQTAQRGDRVQVHYVKRFQDGSVISSRKRGPLEVTVGIDHPLLPTLGLALVGLAPGGAVSIHVPAELAHGFPDPNRIRRWARDRFPKDQPLTVGSWVPVQDRRGHRRRVRIVEVNDRMVVIDTNHPRAGQEMELEVVLLSIEAAVGSEGRRP